MVVADHSSPTIDRVQLVEWLKRQRFDEQQGSEADRLYRRTWNAAIDHVIVNVDPVWRPDP